MRLTIFLREKDNLPQRVIICLREWRFAFETENLSKSENLSKGEWKFASERVTIFLGEWQFATVCDNLPQNLTICLRQIDSLTQEIDNLPQKARQYALASESLPQIACEVKSMREIERARQKERDR